MMLQNTAPAREDVAVTLTLLTHVIELAKDAPALKAEIEKLKISQDELEEAARRSEEKLLALRGETDKLAEATAKHDASAQKADAELSKVAAAFADLEVARAAQREDRNQFDAWMAGEREKLAADRAKVESERAGNASGAEENRRTAEGLVKQAEKLAADTAQLVKDRADYEARITKLREITG